MPEKSIRTAKLDLRLAREDKEKLQAAAMAAQRSASEFVLESALVRADETLTGRTRFDLDAGQWAAFLSALGAQPRQIPRLNRLLQEPSVFESDHQSSIRLELDPHSVAAHHSREAM